MQGSNMFVKQVPAVLLVIILHIVVQCGWLFITFISKLHSLTWKAIPSVTCLLEGSLTNITHRCSLNATKTDEQCISLQQIGSLFSSFIKSVSFASYVTSLTHRGRVTHICVNKLTIIGSDNGLWPGRRQAIIWTNAGILLIVPLGTNFSEILIDI